MDLTELTYLTTQSLRKPGFHVITVDLYEDIATYEKIERKRTSFIDFLRFIEREVNIPRYLRVDGLDEFIARAGDEALQKLRAKLNEKMGTLVSDMSSIVFVVKAHIEDVVNQPTIKKKPLSLIFPRPHDIATVQPGYVHYPIM